MIETFTARGLLGKPPTTDPRNRRSALTAAAARIAESVRRRTKPTEQGTVGAPWQADAWEAYELVGELAFLTTAIASKVGQARMYPGEVADDPRDPPTLLEDGPVAEAFAALTAAPGWFDAIERLALNLMVAGEGWLVGVPRYLLPPELRSDAGDPDPGSPEPVDPADAAWNGWEPLTEEDPTIPVLGAGFDPADLDWWCQSVEELSLSTSGEVHLQLPSAGVPKRVELASGSVLLVRVWEPHPARAWEAGPATRSALPTLRTLTALAMRDAADLDSRLAGAGLLFVPQSAAQAMQNAVGARFNDTDTPEVADQFTDLLIRAASTAIRDRSSAAALVPIVLPVPDETAALFRHMSFAEPLDSAGTEKQTHAIRRLATQMDSPPELLLGTSSMNHWGCVDTATEILTDQGWVSEDGLSSGARILTLNHATGLAEWQVVTDVLRYDVEGEPMTLMEGRGHSSLTTWNHRWPVTNDHHDRREFVITKDLNSAHRIPLCAPNADLPTVAKFSDAFVEVVAWFWTEGSLDHRQGSIAQSESANPEKVAAIRRALNEAFPAGWGSESRQQGEWGSDIVRFNLRKPVRDALSEVGGKRVSLDFVHALTAAQLELFIAASCAGDGWHDRRGDLDIWQRDPAALEAFELALILSGRALAHSQHAGGSVVCGYRKTTIRPVKAARAPGGRMVIETQEYTGTIWCPQVPNGTWLARRKGTVWFTGNSWQVSQETIRSHVEPKLALICRAITTELIAPMLRAQGMTWPDIRRYAIGYDVEHLIVRPNRSGDALELHNRGVISDDAVRDELGFDADDGAEAPDPAVSLVVEMLKKEPTLAQTVGVGSLLETIRELLAGGTPTDTPSATGTGDGERPTGAIPETSEDPAPVGEPA